MDTLTFITSCLTRRRILWTYHVNMRMSDRCISRETMLASVGTFEIIEKYPEDRFFPSYLILARHNEREFHLLAAVDKAGDMVHVITAYYPSPERWLPGNKARRTR